MRLSLSIIFTLIVGAACRADDVDDAAKRVERLGGILTRDTTKPNKPIVGVTFNKSYRINPDIRDANLKELIPLKQLRTLDVSVNLITDVGMKEIAKLDNLTSLNLSVTDVTGAGLKELAGLKHLSHLDIEQTALTDRKLIGLGELQHLKYLNLSGPNLAGGIVFDGPGYPLTVTDVGLKEVAKLKNLTTLKLRHTDVTDKGLKELAALKNLEKLDLSLTRITGGSERVGFDRHASRSASQFHRCQ